MNGKKNRLKCTVVVKVFAIIVTIFIFTSCAGYSENKKLSKIYYREGIAYLNQKEYQKAIDSFNKSLELYSYNNSSVYNMIGIAYKEMKNFDTAMVWLEKAIQSDPSFWASYSEIGDIHRKKGEYDKAITWYIKSKKLNPNAEILYINLCDIFLEVGDIEKAIKECKDGIKKLTPDTSPLHIKLGDIYAEKGLYDEAMIEWNAAKKDPYYKRIYKEYDPIKERLENIVSKQKKTNAK